MVSCVILWLVLVQSVVMSYICSMLSKTKIKLIRSLERKKYRLSTGLFVAEGAKLVSELLEVYACEYLAATAEWLAVHDAQVKHAQVREVAEVTDDELRTASLMQAPQQVLAIFKQRVSSLDAQDFTKELALVLDGVQDPGNLGTIVRVADWFGIRNVICSVQCADIYNPKSTQATMGAMARVAVHYVDLERFLADVPSDVPVYGTLLDGENMYECELSPYGLIVMGSEGTGITPEVRKRITQSLYIPSYAVGGAGSESLNVGVATAVVCAEFMRRK